MSSNAAKISPDHLEKKTEENNIANDSEVENNDDNNNNNNNKDGEINNEFPSTTTTTTTTETKTTTITLTKKPISPSNLFSAKHKSAYISILHSKLNTITKHLEKFDVAISLIKAKSAKEAAEAAAKKDGRYHHVKQPVGRPKRAKRGKKISEAMAELKRSQDCIITMVKRRQEREVEPLNPTPEIPKPLIKIKSKPKPKKVEKKEAKKDDEKKTGDASKKKGENMKN